MSLLNYSQSLPPYVQIKCFVLQATGEKSDQESLLPTDLFQKLASPTRSVDETTNTLMAPDGSCQSLCFAVSLDLVWDEYHLQSAIYRALYFKNVVGKLKAKSLPPEVLYQLASTGKINEAIKQFCLKESSRAFAIISLDESDASEFEQLCQRIANLSSEYASHVSSVHEISTADLATTMATAEKRTAISKVFKTSPAENLAPNFSQVISMKLALKDIEN